MALHTLEPALTFLLTVRGWHKGNHGGAFAQQVLAIEMLIYTLESLARSGFKVEDLKEGR